MAEALRNTINQISTRLYIDIFLSQKVSRHIPTRRFILLKSTGIDLMVKCNEEAESDPLNIHSQTQYKPGFSQVIFWPDNSLLWMAVLYIIGCISVIFGLYSLDAS